MALSRRNFQLTEPVATERYDTAFSPLTEKQVPFFLAKCDSMAELMAGALFNQILPLHPIAERKYLKLAKQSVNVYNVFFGKALPETERVVCTSMHDILNTCVLCTKAAGLDFTVCFVETDGTSAGGMDTVSKLRLLIKGLSSSGVVGEPISPAAFKKHCNDVEVDETIVGLRLGAVESGFRAILFKLSTFIIRKKCRWALIHSGVNMRAVRIEYKSNRPYAIISEQIPTDSAAPKSIYALICYMLFTGDKEVPLFDAIEAQVPEPPSIRDLPDPRHVSGKQWPVPHEEVCQNPFRQLRYTQQLLRGRKFFVCR